jgi:phospholipid transport system substrate-binding protein
MTLLTVATGLAQEAPDQLVRSVADHVLKIVRQDRELRAGSRSEMVGLISREIAPHFDLALMTRLALGRNWRRASPEQHKLLVTRFSDLLIHAYAAAYEADYSGMSVEVEPLRLRPADSDVQVKTKVKLPGGVPPVAVDYSMYRSGPAWKVYDLSVDGVDLIATYRSTFAEAIRDHGIEGLLDSLQRKDIKLASPSR